MNIQMQEIPAMESAGETSSMELRTTRKKQEDHAVRMALLKRMALADWDTGEAETQAVYRKLN